MEKAQERSVPLIAPPQPRALQSSHCSALLFGLDHPRSFSKPTPSRGCFPSRPGPLWAAAEAGGLLCKESQLRRKGCREGGGGTRLETGGENGGAEEGQRPSLRLGGPGACLGFATELNYS